ncbi:MAG: hypothetical protein D6693_01750 [Planctomycetota bacterium]|nr:MAG: hypothetical protein D6693_01750 [Planctomycetota bacterium]
MRLVFRIGWTLAAATAVLGGCAHGGADRMTLLEDENYELRTRLQQLQASADQAEQARRLLEEENRRLQAERDRLELEASRIGSSTASADTGFEGLAGVSTTTNAVGEVVVAVAGDVLFDSGSATLKSSAKNTLNRIAEVLNSRYPGQMIRVAGHTDSDPIRKSKWKTNERLSAERALAVEEYLSSQGVDNDRMYSAGYGSSQPKASKKESRRVEIIVLNIPAG